MTLMVMVVAIPAAKTVAMVTTMADAAAMAMAEAKAAAAAETSHSACHGTCCEWLCLRLFKPLKLSLVGSGIQGGQSK